MPEQTLDKNLNTEQKKAIKHEDGPLLIVAGAGTGKTTVITQRLAWLIQTGRAKADEILALTFTDKAAGEMEERVDKLLPYGYIDLWISTFHAFCERVLKDHALEIGLPDSFKLLSQTEQWLLVRQNLDKFNLDYYKPLGNPTKFIHSLLKHFSRAKDEVIGPEEYLKYAEGLGLNLDNAEALGKGGKIRNSNIEIRNKSKIQNSKSKTRTPDQEVAAQELKRITEVAEAYHVYQNLLLEHQALDFGDLINYTLQLFQKRPAVLEKYRKQFKFILVDEFQDTNFSQYELLKLLASPLNNITVVGDDDQCLPGSAVIDLRKGKKKIKDIKKGDEVLTAVGKGHVGVSKVNRVFKNKKKAKLLEVKTARGYKLNVTDNHKMFCYVPPTSDKKFHYVYLMYKQGFGWRIGTTNDLALRLRLERSADSIVGLKAFNSEEESRFWETVWSLKYGIPTVCFKERNNMMVRGEWAKKLYKEIDVESNVKKLANDFNIDLNSYHYCLGAVNRGSKLRVKINLELCARKYRSKEHVKKGKELLLQPKISHNLTLDTSDKSILKRLKESGFILYKSKGAGYRIRIQNNDIRELGVIAEKLCRITGGFIEAKFNLGRVNYQHWPALVMPAKNLVLGHYLPIRKGKDIIYDQIVGIKEKKVHQTVYDLEIDKTHNFIADGVVVHNSIYKFRGASLSNILQFKSDYPKAEQVVLLENYRSCQEILDLSYDFIQLNNPNRLEAQLDKSAVIKGDAKKKGIDLSKFKSINKKLKSQTKSKGHIEHIHVKTFEDEAWAVVEKIQELKNKDKDATWNDFAVLVRANDTAENFIYALNNAGLPYLFLASRGLYSKAVILDIVNYLKLLDDYHESTAVFRILSLPYWKIPYEDIVALTNFARRKGMSLYESLSQYEGQVQISSRTKQVIEKFLKNITKHSTEAKDKTITQVIFSFLEDFKYLQYLQELDEQKSREAFSYLNQFYKQVVQFEQQSPDKSVQAFMQELNYVLESGEQGALTPDLEEGPEAIKVMTIHGSKGLEFKYTFIVSMVDKRFPTIARHDPIDLPAALVKEIEPEGDVHIQEERRLFYVAMTRAKQGLYFTSGENYGGLRKKKLSRFLVETGLAKDVEPHPSTSSGPSEKADDFVSRNSKKQTVSDAGENVYKNLLPYKFSFTQLRAFQNCPYQYRFSHVLKVPVRGKPQFSFGKAIHATLEKFFSLVKERAGSKQKDLFDTGARAPVVPGKKNKLSNATTKNTPGSAPALAGATVSLDELLDIYNKSWIDDWYSDQEEQKRYKDKGKEALKEFYKLYEKDGTVPKYLEQGFNLRVGEYTLRGVVDRIDELKPGEVELVDYKTGRVKSEKDLTADDKQQLLIYQMAVNQVFKEKPVLLSFYYVEGNKKVSFIGSESDLKKQEEKIIKEIDQIKVSKFPPTPSKMKCKFCDFKSICEYRIL